MSDPVSDDGTEVLDVLGDENAQAILAATSREPMSVKQLGGALDVDLSTIYRHVHHMADRDLLSEGTRIVEDGSHHSVYEANVDRVEVEIDDGQISVELRVRESPAERFTRIWDDIRES